MRGWWLVVIGMGCGKDGGDGDGTGLDFPRACDQSAFDGDCVAFTGANWVEGDVVGACTQAGELLPECPGSAAVGTCTLDAGTDNETVTTFYSPFWTAAQATQQCQGSGGAWVQAS